MSEIFFQHEKRNFVSPSDHVMFYSILYSQLSPRRTPLGQALSVRLREMSVLERCPSYKESNKGNKQRQGPNSRCPFYRGVCLIEVSVKRESTV